MAKIAINGLGRIGRATLKIVMDTPAWTWSLSTRLAHPTASRISSRTTPLRTRRENGRHSR